MKELAAILTECLALVQASDASAYAGMSVAEIAEMLQSAIAKLERGGPIDGPELRLLFAPTGALQETSIDNGWGDKFVALSARFDGAI